MGWEQDGKKTMELKKIKLNELKPAEYNPRRINDEEYIKLSNSLNEFGLVDPIIVNLKNNHIIGGHQRYNVLMKEDDAAEYNLLVLGDIGWVFLDEDLEVRSSEHEMALNVALNKISGEWDLNKLYSVLESVKKNGFNMDLTGFTSHELSLYDDDDDDGEGILFESKLFEDNDYGKYIMVKCPKCSHEFYEE